MKVSLMSPPPRVIMKIVKVFASLVSVALFGAALFAASVAVSQQADGQVQFNIPQDFVIPQNGFRTIDAMVSDPTAGRTVRCHNITAAWNAPIQRIIRRVGCTYTFTGMLNLVPLAGGGNTNGVTASNYICFRSYTTVGNNLVSQQCVTWRYRVGPASSVTFNAPTGLAVAANQQLVINALSYATETDSRYSITCGDATSIDTVELSTVERSGCMFTVTPKNVQGAASFAVPYTSYGGATTSHTIAVQVGPASTIVFTPPSPALSVQSGSSIMIDASSYAADGSYTTTCGTATESSALISISAQTGCSVTVAAGSGTGTAAITVPYMSSGGDTHDGIVNVQVVPASDIVFSAPASNPVVSIDQSLVLDMSSYASDGPYTITCGTATESSALISISAQTGCSVTVAAGSSTGTAVITVPYMSSGGDTHTAMLTVAVIDSNIVYTPPADLTLQIGGILAINAASYAADGAYTITCGEVESKSERIASITRNGCGYIIIPASAGQAEFTITYTSSGGDTHQATIPITIEPSPTAPATPNTAPDYTAPADTAPSDTTSSGTTAPADGTEEAALSWSTLTVQPGGTTARTIRQTLGLSSRTAIYAWNADTQTWTALTDPTRTIPSGAVLSFRGPEEISQQDLEIANIGQSTRRTALTRGWNIIAPPETTTRAADSTSFLFDPSLTDCENNPAVIAIASYNTQTRQWALWLPCHPQAQRTLTAGIDPPYRTLTRINPQDTTYIYTRTAQPINIAWNTQTQTYQPL